MFERAGGTRAATRASGKKKRDDRETSPMESYEFHTDLQEMMGNVRNNCGRRGNACRVLHVTYVSRVITLERLRSVEQKLARAHLSSWEHPFSYGSPLIKWNVEIRGIDARIIFWTFSGISVGAKRYGQIAIGREVINPDSRMQ